MDEEVTAQSKTPKKGSSIRVDFGTLAGLALALAGILGGLILEKGEIRDVAQITAAIIVLCGTFGAVLINTPLPTVMGAMRRFASIFVAKADAHDDRIEEIIRYASKARKQGLVSLEQDAEVIVDPFLRKAVTLAVDGTDLQELRKMLELEISMREHHAEAEAKVFESAGGYSPTIGIIGAVMGLIQVMKNLANVDEVGHGIATAFVATLYGVAIANIILLPAASKIRARSHHETQMRELIVEGVSGIVEGLNPKLIRTKLEAYNPPAPVKKAKKGTPETADAREPAEA